MLESNRFLSLFCFQIGRSSESPIDFVVLDTIAGDKSKIDNRVMASTISRFACRILCDRNNPSIARIYAAGFDSSKNIFLGVSFIQGLQDAEKPLLNRGIFQVPESALK